MDINVYKYRRPAEDQPDDPIDLDLEKKRSQVDRIGGALGLLAGAGGSYYWQNKHKAAMRHVVPKLLAIVSSGYVMGRAGAYTYNDMFNPRQSKLPPEQRKTASTIPDIDSLAISETHKDLLAMSKAYVNKKRIDITQGAAQRRMNALTPPASTKSNTVKKQASCLRLPVIILAQTK